MLSSYSSFLEFSAGVYASICFDDVLKNIWSSQYYRKIRQVFSKLSVYSYTNLSEELQVQNQEWVLSLQKPMIKRAVLMLFLISFSLLFAGAEEELQKTDGLISQFRTSLVFVGLFILLFYFLICKKWVFKNWRNFTISLFVILLLGITIAAVFISNQIACGFCDKYFTPLFILFISIPLIWQIIVSWVYSSLYIGYVKAEIDREIQEYTHAIELLNKKNKSEMPNGYSDIYLGEVLKDVNNANDTCVELFNNRLLGQIKVVTQPHSTIEILRSWFKFRFKVKKNNQDVPIKPTISKSPKYSIPEKVLQSSTVTLKLDYKAEYKAYKDLKKKNKRKGSKYGLKDFCKEHGYKYEEMKLWIDEQNI